MMGAVLQKEKTSIEQCFVHLDNYEKYVHSNMPNSCSSDFKRMAEYVVALAEMMQIERENGFRDYAEKQILGKGDDDRINPNLKDEGYDFSRENSLLLIAYYQVEQWNEIANLHDYDEFVDAIKINMNANKFNPRDYIALLENYLVSFFAKERNVTVIKEGVTNERSDPASKESKFGGDGKSRSCERARHTVLDFTLPRATIFCRSTLLCRIILSSFLPETGIKKRLELAHSRYSTAGQS